MRAITRKNNMAMVTEARVLMSSVTFKLWKENVTEIRRARLREARERRREASSRLATAKAEPTKEMVRRRMSVLEGKEGKEGRLMRRTASGRSERSPSGRGAGGMGFKTGFGVFEFGDRARRAREEEEEEREEREERGREEGEEFEREGEERMEIMRAMKARQMRALRVKRGEMERIKTADRTAEEGSFEGVKPGEERQRGEGGSLICLFCQESRGDLFPSPPAGASRGASRGASAPSPCLGRPSSPETGGGRRQGATKKDILRERRDFLRKVAVKSRERLGRGGRGRTGRERSTTAPSPSEEEREGGGGNTIDREIGN